MNDVFKKIKDSNDKDAGEIFVKEILPLSVRYPHTKGIY